MSIGKAPLGALICLICAAASAADAPQSATQPPAAESAAARPGVRVFIDPQTGQIRQPTDEDWANVRPPLRPKQSRQEQIRTLPNGMLLLPADATMHRMKAQVGLDGSIQTYCETPSGQRE